MRTLVIMCLFALSFLLIRMSQTFGANLERLSSRFAPHSHISFSRVLSRYPPVTQTSFRVSFSIENRSVPSVNSVTLSPSFQQFGHLSVRVPASPTPGLIPEQSTFKANSRLRLRRLLRYNGMIRTRHILFKLLSWVLGANHSHLLRIRAARVSGFSSMWHMLWNRMVLAER
ncbi:hypothetical protein BDR05DRAFT_231137 [Suillus weaverae]|nr:hypothetical protein BDR05DRAFT_231137 [Suillus weaverae]